MYILKIIGGQKTMNKYNLYRLSALLYPNECNSLNRDETIKKIIESFFVITENREASLERLPSLIHEEFRMQFMNEEINTVISSNSIFIKQFDEQKLDSDNNPNLVISIKPERYLYLKDVQESKNIYKHIDDYYASNLDLKFVYTLDDFKKGIHGVQPMPRRLT